MYQSLVTQGSKKALESTTAGQLLTRPGPSPSTLRGSHVQFYVVPVMFLSIVYGKICYVVWQSLKTCDPQRKTMDTHTSTRTGKWLILSTLEFEHYNIIFNIFSSLFTLFSVFSFTSPWE